MPTITTSSIIDKAQTLLLDATGVRWSSAELLGWLNSGQREIVIYKPNVYVKASSVRLVPGTRQALPDDGVQFIDMPCNMGTNGTTPGRAIRQTERDSLDAALRTWHASAPSSVVKNFIFNLMDPKAVYVFPPQPATAQGYVQMVYGAVPPDATTTITVDDIYETILLDYMLYRAFSKDSEFADQGKAAGYQSAWLTALTGKAKAEVGVNPNARAPANTQAN